jgi:hypothetical protein
MQVPLALLRRKRPWRLLRSRHMHQQSKLSSEVVMEEEITKHGIPGGKYSAHGATSAHGQHQKRSKSKKG